jgi:hypothetical protein
MPEIVVTGLAETLQMLDEAPKNIAYLGLGRAAHAAISVIAEALTMRTPIGTGPTAGDLVRALKVDVTVDTGGRGVTAWVGWDRRPQNVIAAALEYGHEMIGHRPASKDLGFIEARPFIRPAFDASAQLAIETFATVLEAELKKTYG